MASSRSRITSQIGNSSHCVRSAISWTKRGPVSWQTAATPRLTRTLLRRTLDSAVSRTDRSSELLGDLVELRRNQARNLFARQAIPMAWDFVEVEPLCRRRRVTSG